MKLLDSKIYDDEFISFTVELYGVGTRPSAKFWKTQFINLNFVFQLWFNNLSIRRKKKQKIFIRTNKKQLSKNDIFIEYIINLKKNLKFHVFRDANSFDSNSSTYHYNRFFNHNKEFKF